MEIVILDTEYTSWAGSLERNWSGPREHKEIVQIAAIAVDANNLTELGHCSLLTRPIINPNLSNYFIELTGITNEIIAKEKLFHETIMEYRNFLGGRPVYACGEEGEIIAANLYINKINDLLELTRVHNLRPWFCSNGLNAEEIPSGKLHEHVGIPLNGRTHDALHDVRSILVSIKYLVQNGAPTPFVL